jgi:ketosteroid isomerase-like protein/ubiquinone/menaquinone biosynthesis C-methylase UbiE
MANLQGNPDIASAYDAWADTYDVAPNRTRELAGQVLRRYELNLAGRSVVEIGCGTGRNTLWLAERAEDVLALDLSDGMLAKARAHVQSPKVRFLQHDVRTGWPAADGSADVVIAMLVLEHVEHLEPIFGEAARVLRSGGDLLICELHPTRQMLGRQAEYTNPSTGAVERVEAFLHDVSEYVNGGLQAGFVLSHLGEWRDDGADPAVTPRVLSLRFHAPAVAGLEVFSMSVERNKELASEFFARLSASDIAGALDLLSDDVTWWIAGKPAELPVAGAHDKEQLAGIFHRMHSRLKDGLRLTVKDMTAEGDKVALELESLGELWNGRVYNNEYHTLMRIRDGKIREVREYLDTQHIFATWFQR